MKTSLPPFKPLPPTESQVTRPPVSSEQLLRGVTTLEIDHAGQRYLLRVTRENKLILTK
jgi:hemin uptake protein HemP